MLYLYESSTQVFSVGRTILHTEKNNIRQVAENHPCVSSACHQIKTFFVITFHR